MIQPSIAVASTDSVLPNLFPADINFPCPDFDPEFSAYAGGSLLQGLKRRIHREVRRRKVGRAYDMALEVARVLPPHSQVLDVGCGSGFVAHHLAALLGMPVVGIDLGERAQARIDYRQFDGLHFPVGARSFDAVMLCYVLHHVQQTDAIIDEMRRVLRAGGLAIIYEDIPESWRDRAVCWSHDLKWRRRTGPCAFRRAREWQQLFKRLGSRWLVTADFHAGVTWCIR